MRSKRLLILLGLNVLAITTSRADNAEPWLHPFGSGMVESDFTIQNTPRSGAWVIAWTFDHSNRGLRIASNACPVVRNGRITASSTFW